MINDSRNTIITYQKNISWLHITIQNDLKHIVNNTKRECVEKRKTKSRRKEYWQTHPEKDTRQTVENKHTLTHKIHHFNIITSFIPDRHNPKFAHPVKLFVLWFIFCSNPISTQFIRTTSKEIKSKNRQYIEQTQYSDHQKSHSQYEPDMKKQIYTTKKILEHEK